MKRILEPASKSYKIICVDKNAPTLSSSDRFFHELPPKVINNIVAQVKNRSAVRKTCKLFAAYLHSNNLKTLVKHPHFEGSNEDIIKACEQCIETDDHEVLQLIVDRYGLNTVSKTNIIGYSLSEYALLLKHDNCFALLSPPDTEDSIPSIESRVLNMVDPHAEQTIRLSTREHVIMDYITTELFNDLYLHKAIGHDFIIQHLLDKQKKLKARDNHSADNRCAQPTISYNPSTSILERSALHIAAYNGDTNLIDLLLATTPDVINDTAHTALHLACMRGFPRCVAQLLTAGCNPNVTLKKDLNYYKIHKTALDHCAQHGFTECARLLLNSKKLANKAFQCQSALLYATASGNAELVELLLTEKTDPNIHNENILKQFDKDRTVLLPKDDFMQPLEIAVYYGDLILVQKLVTAGAYITEYSLAIAQAKNHNEILPLLQEKRLQIENNKMITNTTIH